MEGFKKMDNFDNFIKNLQEEIFEDTRRAYGEIGFQRWRNPRYLGKMKHPDVHAKITGICGDTMEIFLKFENSRVKNASCLTDGCGSSTVCGSFAAEMALQKTPDELTDITGETILEKIGTFPKEDEHCAYLAAETLQKALHIFMSKQTESPKDTPEGTPSTNNIPGE
jgi:nitrogen fixation NifU-like protein